MNYNKFLVKSKREPNKLMDQQCKEIIKRELNAWKVTEDHKDYIKKESWSTEDGLGEKWMKMTGNILP